MESVVDHYGKIGERCDYPIASFKVGEEVVSKRADFGILVCGSGIGVSIAANKVKGIRAVCAHDVTTARLSRQHNNCNVLTLGGRLIGYQTATDIIDAFLNAKFEDGRHTGRVQLMSDYENKK
jgi:ribose 5-phosphate isomerase B